MQLLFKFSVFCSVTLICAVMGTIMPLSTAHASEATLSVKAIPAVSNTASDEAPPAVAEFEGSLIHDLSRIHTEGYDHSPFSRALLDVGLKIDLEQLIGLSNAIFFINTQLQDGEESTAILSDIQGYSNIDNDDFVKLSQFWIEQKLFNEKLTLQLGSVDANAKFAAPEAAGEFISSSMGFSPTIFPMPTYPDPALSFNIQWTDDPFYISAGIFDGGGDFTKPFTSIFSIAEAGFTSDSLGPLGATRLVLGGWHHNGEFPSLKQINTTISNTFGLYALAESVLWEQGDRNLALFLQFGNSEKEVAEMLQHLGWGLTLTGPTQNRTNDILGFGATWVTLNPAFFPDSHKELSIELFYKAQVRDKIAIKVDNQYIIDPGGDHGALGIFVTTARLELEI